MPLHPTEFRYELLEVFSLAIAAERRYPGSEGANDLSSAAFQFAASHGWDYEGDSPFMAWGLNATQAEILFEGLKQALLRCKVERDLAVEITSPGHPCLDCDLATLGPNNSVRCDVGFNGLDAIEIADIFDCATQVPIPRSKCTYCAHQTGEPGGKGYCEKGWPGERDLPVGPIVRCSEFFEEIPF